MTKKELVAALAPLDDDATVDVYVVHSDMDYGTYAHDIYFDDIVSGDEYQNEITIVAHIA